MRAYTRSDQRSREALKEYEGEIRRAFYQNRRDLLHPDAELRLRAVDRVISTIDNGANVPKQLSEEGLVDAWFHVFRRTYARAMRQYLGQSNADFGIGAAYRRIERVDNLRAMAKFIRPGMYEADVRYLRIRTGTL